MWDIFVLYELVIYFIGQCTTAISIHYETGIETTVIPIKMLSLSGAKSGDRSHVFQTLIDTDTQVRSEFATALKKLSKVVSELCKQEKEVWVLSDELEEQCQAMTKRVDNTTQQLVCYKFSCTVKAWLSNSTFVYATRGPVLR